MRLYKLIEKREYSDEVVQIHIENVSWAIANFFRKMLSDTVSLGDVMIICEMDDNNE